MPRLKHKKVCTKIMNRQICIKHQKYSRKIIKTWKYHSACMKKMSWNDDGKQQNIMNIGWKSKYIVCTNEKLIMWHGDFERMILWRNYRTFSIAYENHHLKITKNMKSDSTKSTRTFITLAKNTIGINILCLSTFFGTLAQLTSNSVSIAKKTKKPNTKNTTKHQNHKNHITFTCAVMQLFVL